MRSEEGSAPAGQPPAQGATRAELMRLHADARRRRDAAQLGSEEYRAAAEEVGRIEVAIAHLEEPSPSDLPPG